MYKFRQNLTIMSNIKSKRNARTTRYTFVGNIICIPFTNLLWWNVYILNCFRQIKNKLPSLFDFRLAICGSDKYREFSYTIHICVCVYIYFFFLSFTDNLLPPMYEVFKNQVLIVSWFLQKMAFYWKFYIDGYFSNLRLPSFRHILLIPTPRVG
jgi:hypothetical protein